MVLCCDLSWPTVVCLIITIIVFLKFLTSGKVSDVPVPKDTVLVHFLPRGRNAPSISPYPIKLETFLRMHNIPYVINTTTPFNKVTGKVPWMEYNGVKVTDSQLCIEYLRKERHLPSDPHLNNNERAIARGFLKLTEENLYWCLAAVMFIDNPDIMRKNLPHLTGLNYVLTSIFLRWTIKKEMYGHGIGRHSPETISMIGHHDLKALSDFLGDKPFMMGDIPSEIDCSVFGMLCQAIYHIEGFSLNLYIMNELPNLLAFAERMRDKYWPDWENCKFSRESNVIPD